jgi:hypothetical protein
MSADKTPAPEKLPAPEQAKAQPAPKPPKPIDHPEHGRVRKPHGGA